MAEDTSTSIPQDRQDGASSGGRQGGSREPGGFRIRLSDNEMRSARAIQEAFGLRSTVAALGFSIRTIAQMLEEGQLDALVAQQRSQTPARSDGPRGGAGGARPQGRGEGRGDARGEGRGERRDDRPQRANPFARPSKPVPAPVEVEEPMVEASAELVEASGELETGATAQPQPSAAESLAAESSADGTTDPVSADSAAADPAAAEAAG
jgi:hypothetical protein